MAGDLEAQYRAFNGRLIIKAQSATVSGLFEFIAELAEVFDIATVCGLCQSPHIRPQVRIVGKFKFHELRCDSCTARMDYGQNMEGGGLFPKTKDKDGKPLANGGWYIYTGTTNQLAAPAETQQQAPTAAPRQAPTNGTRPAPATQGPYNRREPQPVSRPDTPKLKQLLARGDPNGTMRDLYDGLRAVYDEEIENMPTPKTDAAWKKCAPKGATDQQIIRALYWKIQEEVPTDVAAAS